MEELSDEAKECRGTVRHVTSGETIHFRDFERLKDFVLRATLRHHPVGAEPMDATPTTPRRHGQTNLGGDGFTALVEAL